MSERQIELYKRNREIYFQLIADLSDGLTDEGPDWTVQRLALLRARVANVLPPDVCPDWLKPFRDPSLVHA